MSYRELTMIEIKEVLRRWQAAQNLHQIARETALDRQTVRRYLGAAKLCGLARNGALDEAAIACLSKRVHRHPAAERTTYGDGVARDLLPEPELVGARCRCRGRRVHGARHGAEAESNGPRAWMRERPGPCVRSGHGQPCPLPVGRHDRRGAGCPCARCRPRSGHRRQRQRFPTPTANLHSPLHLPNCRES